MENYQHKAFISYRHTSVDQDIAKRLHTLLENYKIPSTLKKSLGISKIGRIFRDNEELPLSADLGEDIHIRQRPLRIQLNVFVIFCPKESLVYCRVF